MKNQFVDFDGNFGSQDPALQPTPEDFARLSEYLKGHRVENEQLIVEARQAVATMAKPVVQPLHKTTT